MSKTLGMFTAGKWLYERDVKDKGWEVSVLDKHEDHQIARVFDHGDEEDRFNAKLIVASPRMFRALEAVAQTFAKAQGAMDPEEYSVIEEVQAALREAAGIESPK